MARGNGTGPKGEGPKTGRGLGDCGLEQNAEEIKKQTIGQKIFRGIGLGRGKAQRGGQGRGR